MCRILESTSVHLDVENLTGRHDSQYKADNSVDADDLKLRLSSRTVFLIYCATIENSYTVLNAHI